jgi:non-ribosomal peptide synthetase component F
MLHVQRSSSHIFSGSKLIIPRKEDLLSAGSIINLIKKHKIDLVTLPPSYQALIKESLQKHTHINFCREPLNVALAKEAQSRGVRVFNAYGPTENTVCITMSPNPVLPGGTVTIGKPID